MAERRSFRTASNDGPAVYKIKIAQMPREGINPSSRVRCREIPLSQPHPLFVTNTLRTALRCHNQVAKRPPSQGIS